jgi:hypothetical protein
MTGRDPQISTFAEEPQAGGIDCDTHDAMLVYAENNPEAARGHRAGLIRNVNPPFDAARTLR